MLLSSASSSGLLKSLPASPKNKKGWPWIEETPINTFDSDKNYPRISIVTPSYNQGQFLEETIRSVLLQNYPNLEYIIIDGGSTDNSLEIIKKYSSWLKFWISEKDNGQTHALNKGIEQCSGIIFNWLNSDDFYEAGALKIVSESFLSNPLTTCVTGKERRIDEYGNFKNFSFGTTICERIENTVLTAHIDQPSTFFKLNKIKELGTLNESLSFCMDVDLWIRYLLKNGQENINKTEETLVNFRYHKDSKTVSFIEKFRKEHEGLILNLCEILKISRETIPYLTNAKKIPVSENVSFHIPFDKNYFKNCIKEKYNKYLGQKSLFLREIASYYLTMNLFSQSAYFSRKALITEPLQIVNWKFFLKSLLRVNKQ